MNRFTQLATLSVAFLIGSACGAAGRALVAQAAPHPGLWLEGSTAVDGIKVSKIRDTTGGDFNICYLATRESSDSSPPALSCVPERRP